MNNQPNIIGVTGHRSIVHEITDVKNIFRDKILEEKADIVITGMALGFDTIVAEVCAEENIPFVAAIPFIGQQKVWSSNDKERYEILVKASWKHKIVSTGGYAVWKMFARNNWIVDNSDKIISYWNGEEKGGTFQCIKYAKKADRSVINLFPFCSHHTK